MEEIKGWLNGSKDYQLGIALYAKHGRNPQLKRLFKEERTDFKVKKLHEVLKELYASFKSPASEEVQAKNTVKVSPHNQYKHWPAEPIADPVVVALKAQWKPLYSKMLSLQQRIREVAAQGASDQNKRREAGMMAHEILDIDDEVEWIYAKRNFYYQHSRLPEDNQKPPPDLIVTPVKMAIELQNNERYVRRFTQKLKDFPAHKNADKWAVLLKEKITLVAFYKKQLNIE